MTAGPADAAPRRIPTPLREFLALHERGEHWESHEVLEGAWRETGSDFYQALILYASAWVHWKKGNAHGVDAQLRKTRERLSGYPDTWLGVDVAAIRTHCREVRDVVRTRPDEWVSGVAPLPLGIEQGRIRGDEPELGGARRRDAREDDPDPTGGGSGFP